MLWCLVASGTAATVGAIPGQFNVTATGAATYSIAFKLPPGINGLAPQLGLGYQSQGGNGMVGVGWALTGFSTITRCANTIAQDGHTEGVTFTSDDRFCLDGNKLRLQTGSHGADGATYRTELDTFARITSYTSGGAGATPTSGPQWFKVEMPNGLTYEYGKTADAEILDADGTAVRVWALDKIIDTDGNFIRFKYINDPTNGSYRPSEVDYTGHGGVAGPHKVIFGYQTVPGDAKFPDGYLAGTRVRQPKRLATVTIKYNGSAVTQYTLTYDTSPTTARSRLTNITECGGGLCYPTTTIEWQNGAATWGTATNMPDVANPHILDLNGDGYADMIYHAIDDDDDPDNDVWAYRLGGPGGFAAEVTTPFYVERYTTGEHFVYGKGQTLRYGTSGRASLFVNDAFTHKAALFKFDQVGLTVKPLSFVGPPTDFNGDGLDDLISWDDDTNSSAIKINTGSGFGVLTPISGDPGTIPADFNGDGRTDWISKSVTSKPGDPCVHPGDPSSQCRLDYAWVATQADAAGFHSIHTFPIGEAQYGNPPPPMPAPLTGDLNGDGLSDIVLGDSVYFSTGAGFTAMALPTGACAPKAVVPGAAPVILAQCSAQSWQGIHYLNGNFRVEAVSLPFSGAPSAIDINGDGLNDLIGPDWVSVDSEVYLVHEGTKPDLVTRITDGLGNFFKPSYKPLTNSAVYTKGNGATYPQQDIETPRYVVSQYTANNGIGGEYTKTYTYEGARMNLTGRGFLGFARITITDSRNNISTIIDYEQDFPYTGSPRRIRVQQSNGETISDTVNTYGNNDDGNAGAHTDRYFAFVKDSKTTTYGLDGYWIKTIETHNTYNANGRPSDVTITTSGGGKMFSVESVTTYANNAAT